MNTIAQPTVDGAERARPHHRLLHIYPGCECGGRVPAAGEKALCGRIRRSTNTRPYSIDEAGRDACVVCVSIYQGNAA